VRVRAHTPVEVITFINQSRHSPEQNSQVKKIPGERVTGKNGKGDNLNKKIYAKIEAWRKRRIEHPTFISMAPLVFAVESDWYAHGIG
jgi:hypothetical protein